MNDARFRTTAGRCAQLASMIALSFPALAQEPPAPQQPQSDPVERTRESLMEARVGVAQSDNFRRVPTNEEDGTLVSAGFGIDTLGRSPRLQYRAQGDLDWIRYPDNSFGTKADGYFDGDATFAIVPDTFNWFFQETFGQLVSDPFASRTPDTVENVNNFSTGPDLNFRFGAATVLGLYGSYSKLTYDKSPLDSNIVGGGIELGRELSSSSRVSVNASRSSIDFDDDAAGADYDIDQYFLRYSARGTRTRLLADAGYSQVDQLGEKSGGTLARLTLSRRITSANVLELVVSRQFSSNGQLFRERLGRQTPGDASLTLANGDAFEDTTYGGSWEFQASRTTFQLFASRARERYETSVLANRTISSLDARVERRMRPSLTLRVAARYAREDFDNIDFEDTRRSAEIALDWRAGRRLGTTLRYQWFKDDATLAEADYSENRLALELFYRFGRQ
jgi:hypothetical protein